MKLAHISDLHIDAQFLPENTEKTERLLLAAAESNVDHLLVAGDITHDAQIRDLGIFRNLLAKYDFLHPERLSLTIGNHDIFGGVHLVKELLHFPQRCKLANYQAKVQIFVNYFKEAFQNAIPLHNQDSFPFVKFMDNIMIIGLNSIARYSPIKNVAASNGHISAQDIQILKNLLYYKRLVGFTKIVLIHHHFFTRLNSVGDESNRFFDWIEGKTMKLAGRKRLIQIFKQHKVKLVVHGHVHSNKEYEFNSMRFLNGGGSLKDDVDGRMKLNLIEVDQQDVNIKIISLPAPQFVPQDNNWTEELLPALAF